MTVETGQISSRLLELQSIDDRIREVRERIRSFEPMLDAADEPARSLEQDVEITSNRVRELHLEERRSRLAADEKRQRLRRLEDRLNLVRTIREEAAVQAELGLVRRALDQEEFDVVSLLDQIAKFEERLATQREALEEARSAVEPKRNEILVQQEAAHAKLASMELERELFASGIGSRYLSVYDKLAKRGRRSAVTRMTGNGACGACFSVIPLQLQNEIRTTAPLIRCEACGAIVTAPLPPEEDGSPESANRV